MVELKFKSLVIWLMHAFFVHLCFDSGSVYIWCNWSDKIVINTFLNRHYFNTTCLSLGYRTSVASSTDTGDDHDTDIDDPAPLPPPRPRHWAKRAKEQSMVPEGSSSIPGKIADEDCKADDPSSPSDWSRSVPQFPLPTFKPTMQSKLI